MQAGVHHGAGTAWGSLHATKTEVRTQLHRSFRAITIRNDSILGHADERLSAYGGEGKMSLHMLFFGIPQRESQPRALFRAAACFFRACVHTNAAARVCTWTTGQKDFSQLPACAC
eukprot:1146246-Pelagomonas_calceolata.AAC.1